MAKMRFPRLSEVYPRNMEFGGGAAVCPHCGNPDLFADHNWLNTKSEVVLHRGSRVAFNHVEVGRCSLCSGPVLGLKLLGPNGWVRAELVWPADVWSDGAPAELEPEIRQTYDEARLCLPVSSKAAAVLARRCIQHVLRQKLGIRKKTLKAEIDEAQGRPELSHLTKQALHDVRLIGNESAHPSVDVPGRAVPSSGEGEGDPAVTAFEVSEQDARYALEVVEMLFEDLCVAPARYAEVQQRLAPLQGDKEQRTP
jgi:hypothetical protein